MRRESGPGQTPVREGRDPVPAVPKVRMRTVRVYREGSDPSTAIAAQGMTPASAMRNAIMKMGLRPGKTSDIVRVSSRHRIITWAGVRLHVLEEARSGDTRNTEGLRLLSPAWVSPEAATRFEEMTEILGTKRAAHEWALMHAPMPKAR